MICQVEKRMKGTEDMGQGRKTDQTSVTSRVLYRTRLCIGV